MRTGVKLVWVIALTVLGLAAGCGPEIPEEDLGKVEFRVPNLPGTEERFPLPLDVVAAKESDTGEHEEEYDH